jgi:hypothetical protein
MNYDAVGTEHFGIPESSPARDMTTWFAPPHCVQNCSAVHLPWSKDGDLAYKQRVLDAHVVAFTPLRKLLLRANIAQDFPNLTALTASFEHAALGFFQTGAAMEQDQVFNQRYAVYEKWCLPGHTYGFAEQAGFWQYTSTWPRDPSDPDVGLFSKVQFAYWLMLSNMNSGVAASGLHFDPMMLSSRADDAARVPLDTSAFQRAYSFFDTYAGYHAHPDASPGAWVAFRGQGDHYPAGDFTFLMASDSASAVGVTRLGSNASAYGAWCKALPPGEALVVTHLLTDGQGQPLPDVTVRVVWYDAVPDNATVSPRRGAGAWHLEANTTDGPEVVMRHSVGATGAWVESVANVSRCTSRSLRLVNTARVSDDAAYGRLDAFVAFHMIEVSVSRP